MTGPVYRYFTDDHRRLEDLFERATADPARIDDTLYREFRRGLLKHIGMEEKILLPAAQRRGGGEPLPVAAKIRLDHGAIAALLVPPPSRVVIAALRDILTRHDALEESPGGVYEFCEQIVGDEADELLDQLRHAPDVPPNPYNPHPRVIDATRRALERAGYNLDDYDSM